MASTLLKRTVKYIENNRKELEKELENLDAKILELQEMKAKLSTFIKAFPANTSSKSQNNRFTATSPQAIKIARILYAKDEFTSDDFYQLALKEAPGFEKNFVYNIFGFWKDKSWLESLGSGRYKIKEALIIANENKHCS